MTILELQRIARQAAEQTAVAQSADELGAYAAQWDATAGPYDELIVDEERRRWEELPLYQVPTWLLLMIAIVSAVIVAWMLS